MSTAAASRAPRRPKPAPHEPTHRVPTRTQECRGVVIAAAGVLPRATQGPPYDRAKQNRVTATPIAAKHHRLHGRALGMAFSNTGASEDASSYPFCDVPNVVAIGVKFCPLRAVPRPCRVGI